MTEDPKIIFNQISQIFKKFYKHIIITTVFATVCAIIITSPYFIKPEYSSLGIVYPPAKYTNKYENNSNPEFGNELQADEHMQILLSNQLRDSIVKHFDLITVYKIDTLNQKWKDKLHKIFEQKIAVNRTAFNSIEIKISDNDPELAAKMVKDVADMGDIIKESIIKKSYSAIVENTKREYYNKKHETDSLFFMLNIVGDNNFKKDFENKKMIHDKKVEFVASLLAKIEKIRTVNGANRIDVKIDQINHELINSQSEKLNYEGMLSIYKKEFNPKDTILINTEAKYLGAEKKLSKLEEELNLLTSINREYVYLENLYTNEISQLAKLSDELNMMSFDFEKVIPNVNYETIKQIYQSEIQKLIQFKTNYDNALNNYNEPYIHSYIISYPEVSYNKVYPKRLLITGITLILSFIISISILMFFEKFKASKSAYNNS